MEVGVRGKKTRPRPPERCGPYAFIQKPVSDVRAHPLDSAALRAPTFRWRGWPGILLLGTICRDGWPVDHDFLGMGPGLGIVDVAPTFGRRDLFDALSLIVARIPF